MSVRISHRGIQKVEASRSCDAGLEPILDSGVRSITVSESMSVPLGTKFITTLIGVLIVLTQTPASAQNSVDLGGTDCGSLSPQQCRATQILRAQSLLQSWRVYGAQPQLTVPALSGMLATGNSAYAYSPSVRRHTKGKQQLFWTHYPRNLRSSAE